MRAHYFRPVLTMVERPDGGYDAYLDFRHSYMESSLRDNPDEFEADDSDPETVAAQEALKEWIEAQPDSMPNSAYRFRIPAVDDPAPTSSGVSLSSYAEAHQNP